MKKKYLYQGEIIDQDRVSKAASNLGMDIPSYLNKYSIKEYNDTYEYQGEQIPFERVHAASQKLNMDVDAYIDKYLQKKSPFEDIGKGLGGGMQDFFKGVSTATKNISPTQLNGKAPSLSPNVIEISPEEQARVERGNKQFELSDITIDENDPLRSINNAILEKTIKYKPPQSESTKQQYLLPEHQQRGLSDNLTTRQSKIVYEQVKHQMFPTFRVAENYLNTKGGVQENNTTDLAAAEKYNKGLADRKIVDQFQIPEMAAAEQAISEGRTDIAYLQKQGKEIPKEEMGRLLLNYMNNPNNIEYAQENPRLALQLKEIRDNFPSNYPDATVQQLAQYITDKRQEKGYNTGILKTFLPIHKVSTGDEIIQEGIEKGDLPNSWKNFYDKYKQIVDLKVKTPDLASNFGEGIYQGLRGMASTAAAPLESVLTSQSDVLQDELSKTETHIKPKGLLQNITVHGGNFTGFMLPMIAGGQALKAANILKNSATARDMALFGATSLGEDINRVRVENPDMPTGLQYVLGLLSTGQKVALASKLGFGKALEAKVNTAAIKEIVENFTNGKITSEEAVGRMQKLYERAVGAVKGGAETGTIIGSMGVVDNLLQQVFSNRPFDIAEAGQAGWEGFKSGFFGGLFLKGLLPSTKPTVSKVIYEALKNPEKTRDAILSQDIPDIEKTEQISNLEHALRLQEQLPQDWSEKQKRQFIMEDLVKKTKKENLPENKVLATRPLEEINKHEESQQKILEGRDVYKEPEETFPEGSQSPSTVEPTEQPLNAGKGEEVKVAKTPKERQESIGKQAAKIEIDETNPYQVVLKYFATGGKIHPSAIEELYGNKEKRLSMGSKIEGERKSRIGMLSNNAPTIKSLAEKLMEDRYTKENITDQDFRNAIEDVIQNHISGGSAARELLGTFKAVQNELTPEEAKHIDEITTRQLEKIVDEMPEEHRNELINLLKDYQDEHGFIDWEKLDKDSNGLLSFEPKILSLPTEIQKSLDELIQKNISAGQTQSRNILGESSGEEKTKTPKATTEEGINEKPIIQEGGESQVKIQQPTEVKEPSKTDVNEDKSGTVESQFKEKKNELVMVEGEEMSAGRGKRLMEKRIDALETLIDCLTKSKIV